MPVVEEAARTLRRGGRVEAARLGPVLTTLGTLYDYTGRPDAARDTLDAALVLLRATFGDDHPKTLLALASRALVDARAGRNVSAKPLARDAFERAHRTLPPDDPIRLHAATVLAQALCGMAPDSVRLGTALARDALAARRDLYGADHYLTATTESVAGVCLVASGRAGEARPLLTHAYAALRDARGDADARTADARHRLAALGPAVAPSRP